AEGRTTMQRGEGRGETSSLPSFTSDGDDPTPEGASRSIGVEVEDEVLEGLLVLVLLGLEVLDGGLILLQLGLLLAELLEVAFVQAADRGRLAQVGTQTLLVLDDDVDLPAGLGDLALRLVQTRPQVQRLAQAL